MLNCMLFYMIKFFSYESLYTELVYKEVVSFAESVGIASSEEVISTD